MTKKLSVWFILTMAAFVVLAMVSGCATDEKNDTNDTTDGDVLEQESTEQEETVAEEEVETTELESTDGDIVDTVDDVEYESCASNQDCDVSHMCMSPGLCVPATGHVKGKFEVSIPGEINGRSMGGTGPGYVFGDYRGEGVYIGSSVECENDVIDRDLGFTLQIDMREMLADGVYKSLIIYINNSKIQANTTIEFGPDTFKGTLRKITIKNGREHIENWAKISGGKIEFQYANPQPLDRVIAKFDFQLKGI